MEHSLISSIGESMEFKIILASLRTRVRTAPRIIPSTQPSGWFDTTTSGPEAGIFAISSGSASNFMPMTSIARSKKLRPSSMAWRRRYASSRRLRPKNDSTGFSTRPKSRASSGFFMPARKSMIFFVPRSWKESLADPARKSILFGKFVFERIFESLPRGHYYIVRRPDGSPDFPAGIL